MTRRLKPACVAREIENRFGPRFLTLQHPHPWLGGRVAISAGTLPFQPRSDQDKGGKATLPINILR